MSKKLVIDLDGTICTQEKTGTYQLAKPNISVIMKMNKLWTNGWHITIFTARGMHTYNNDVDLISIVYKDLTKKWLKDNKVCYDVLKFGKPAADLYVDDKGLVPFSFVNNDIK